MKGKASWFLPFNKGWNDGAGNPPNPNGLKIDYLWKQILTRERLTNIIENYARVVTTNDKKRAQKKLRRYVEGYEHAIRLKAEIMVDHFHEQAPAPGKIGGKARAVLVTGSTDRTIKYFHAVSDYLTERRSSYQAIIAFSGEHEYGGANVSEASLNGFSSAEIVDRIQEDPYRILVCADRFQTGYDEPLLHTMYADTSYQNARENSDRQNARIECDNALSRVITGLLQVDTELLKEFMDNDSFRNWLQNTVFDLTYTEDKAA